METKTAPISKGCQESGVQMDVGIFLEAGECCEHWCWLLPMSDPGSQGKEFPLLLESVVAWNTGRSEEHSFFMWSEGHFLLYELFLLLTLPTPNVCGFFPPHQPVLQLSRYQLSVLQSNSDTTSWELLQTAQAKSSVFKDFHSLQCWSQVVGLLDLWPPGLKSEVPWSPPQVQWFAIVIHRTSGNTAILLVYYKIFSKGYKQMDRWRGRGPKDPKCRKF